MVSIVFSKVFGGFDRHEVNSYLYDTETGFIEKNDMLERKIKEQNDILKKKQEKIKRLEDKIKEASVVLGSIETIDNELKLASESILKQREDNIRKVNDFYEDENKKAQENIKNLDEEFNRIRDEYKNLITTLSNSVNAAFEGTFYFSCNDEISAGEMKYDEEDDNIIGKNLINDIVDNDGNVIAVRGTPVDAEMLEILERKNMLLELLKSV